MTEYPTHGQEPWSDQFIAAIEERIAVPQVAAEAAQADATQALADASAAQSDATDALADAATAQAAAVASVQPGRQIIAGTGLSGGGTLAADRTLTVAYGSAAGTSAQGNDSRFTIPRTTLTRSTTVALTSGVAASWTWSAASVRDGGPTHAGGPIIALPAFNADWTFRAKAVFASGGTGSRYFRIYRASDDVLVGEASATGPGGSTDPVIVTCVADWAGLASETFYCLAEQNSGGSINLTSVILTATLITRT